MTDSWDSCYHCLLVGGRGVASSVAGCQHCASWCPCHGKAGIRLQSPSSHPSNPLPYPGSYGALAGGEWPRAWATRSVGDRRECPLICCLMWPVNSSCWTCSDAHNIGRYNSSRYDSIRYTQYRFRYDTDPIIVRSLVESHSAHISLVDCSLPCSWSLSHSGQQHFGQYCFRDFALLFCQEMHDEIFHFEISN